MRTSLGIFLVLLSGAAGAQQLGTLFHTPAERDALERMRRGDPVAGAAAMPLADPVVTGYVKRSDGKSTVFIDKRPYRARDPRMQEALEPRIIQRYEPLPLPPPVAPSATEGEETSGKPAASPKSPASAAQGAKGE